MDTFSCSEASGGCFELYNPKSMMIKRDVLEIHRMCVIFSHICCRFLDSFQWFSGDPTFMEMKTAFWESPEPFDPLGADILCPRDGKPGCALVDWIDRDERREQSHFMSWTWQYRLMQVRSALEMYQSNSSAVPADVFLDRKLKRFQKCSFEIVFTPPFSWNQLDFFLIWVDATPRFFFMCFFVNNQHRILLEKCTTGSADLESIFECNLKRIGRVVAVLDTWNQPLYLGRVWTMYEQFVASTLQIPVCFVMPEDSTVSRWKVFNILSFVRFPTLEQTWTIGCRIDIYWHLVITIQNVEGLQCKGDGGCNISQLGTVLFCTLCFSTWLHCFDMYFVCIFGPGAVESRNFSWRCRHQPCDMGSQSYWFWKSCGMEKRRRGLREGFDSKKCSFPASSERVFDQFQALFACGWIWN